MNMMNQLAAMAILSAGGGYGSRIRMGPAEQIIFGGRTREITPEEEERRAKRRAELRKHNAQRAARIAARKAMLNPHYATEPKREEFPSRQTFREAHRKWSKQ